MLVCNFPAGAAPAPDGDGAEGCCRKPARRKKAVLWAVSAAVIVCAALAVCLLTNPFSKEMPLPVSQSKYRVAEVVYQNPIYSFFMVAGENTPSYALSSDMQLASSGEHGERGEWVSLGKMEETTLTKKSFDGLFMPDGGAGWLDAESAAALRRSAVKAWSLIYNREILYYLIEQKNGELYLAYGYCDYSEKTDAYSDDSSIRWLFRLEAESVEGAGQLPCTTYVSQQCLYLNPLSSYAAVGGDSGCVYKVGEDSFEIVRRSGEVQASMELKSREWQAFPYTDGEWAALYAPSSGAVSDIRELYDELQYLPLSTNRFLLRADGTILLAELGSNPQMGTYLWSIYSLVPESEMGSAQWEYSPGFSSRSPVFRFYFDMEYTEISAACEGGLLAQFNFGDNESASALIFPADEPLSWSPHEGEQAAVSSSVIHFTLLNGDAAQRSGTIYIKASDRGVYTASLVGTGLHLSQNTQQEGGIISAADENG